ncbi:putative transcription factor MADS-type1 family [Helianthus debilis subsp. tardiflorus]
MMRPLYMVNVFTFEQIKQKKLITFFTHLTMMPKKSKGRQKIQMARMEKESNLLVTFSKRRSGLFKKASELCILCGVEIAIIVFSPGKKVFSFGHPSVEIIVDRFLKQNPPLYSSTTQLMEAHRNANIHELNRQLAYEISHLEVEKNKSEELTKIRKEGIDNQWWEAPIESLGIEELERLKVAMGFLKREIEEQKKRIVAANPLQIVPVSGPNCIGGEYIAKGSGLDLAMTPHGFVLGFGNFSR